LGVFLIQTVEGEIKHDFSFHLLKAIEYQNWYRDEIVYQAVTGDHININNYPGYIPVGSLEFVFAYIANHHHKKNLIPINIPVELTNPKKYTKRKFCSNVPKDHIKSYLKEFGKKCFIKSCTTHKGFTDILHGDMTEHIPEDRYFVSEVISILSEWRAFVYRSQLVGLKNYSGDFIVFPDVDLVREMISNYKLAPLAYTLDVGIGERGTFLIEVHPFVSCGLYGFDDYRILPQMFIQGFKFYL
jgi:hypothetical protein